MSPWYSHGSLGTYATYFVGTCPRKEKSLEITWENVCRTIEIRKVFTDVPKYHKTNQPAASRSKMCRRIRKKKSWFGFKSPSSSTVDRNSRKSSTSNFCGEKFASHFVLNLHLILHLTLCLICEMIALEVILWFNIKIAYKEQLQAAALVQPSQPIYLNHGPMPAYRLQITES